MWRGLRSVVLLSSMLAALVIPKPASARERGPRVLVVCPYAPIPARIASHLVLAYELQITNFDKVPLSLRKLEIFAGSRQAAPLESLSGNDLATIIYHVGANDPVESSQVVNPGNLIVAFVWVEIPSGIPLPKSLGHRMTFLEAGVKSSEPLLPAESTIERLNVPVSGESMPVLDSPFQGGVWVAGDGPANDSAHRRSLLAIDGHVHAPERFASDWVKVGPNGDSRRGTAHNEDYWCYNEPILAVADGEVTQVSDGIPDNTPRQLPKQISLDNILGNYIVLRIAPDRYVTYAHLRQGSVKVSPHERVKRGNVIARLGNSGQTTGPHLHMQVTNGNSGLESDGVPFVFRGFTDLGPGSDYETDKHPSIPRTESLPGKDEVVRFAIAGK